MNKTPSIDIRITGEKADETDHEEVELLLEAYAADLNHISSEANRMKVALDDTDDFVNTHLSTMRNKIIRMSLFMEMGMFSIAVPALLAGKECEVGQSIKRSSWRMPISFECMNEYNHIF